MRFYVLLAISVLVATPAIHAQPAPEKSPTVEPTPLPMPVEETFLEYKPSCLAENHSRWAMDFLVGAPTAIRLQRGLGDERRWVLEAFTGLELIFPVTGVGLRRRFLICYGECDALMVSPGVDGYLVYNIASDSGGLLGGGPDFWGMIGVDVDITWKHSWSRHWEGEAGLKLGVLPIRGTHDGDEIWFPIPVVSLIFGCHF